MPVNVAIGAAVGYFLFDAFITREGSRSLFRRINLPSGLDGWWNLASTRD